MVEILVNLIASVETALLIFALLYGAKAIMEKADAVEKKGFFQKAFFYLAGFILLKVLRLTFF